MSGGKERKVDPEKKCPISHNIPGWRESVQPLRESSLFWHSVWISAGRPSTGVLRDIMAKTRNKYHLAIRRAKNMSDSVRAKKLLEAAQTGDINLHIKSLRTKFRPFHYYGLKVNIV